MAKWIRECQACGHKQEAKPPLKTMELPMAYTDAKCKRCNSEALDYGKWIEGE